MFDYVIQKENSGWSVWSCAPHTGDKRDFLRSFSTKRAALNGVDRLRNAALNRQRLSAIVNRAIVDGAEIVTEIKA